MNLTCGRNPWKRASTQDSTFKAFRKDPNFLKSILPISDELNFILQRIFEVDPQKRITIEELIELMQRIPRLTTSASEGPITPPYTPAQSPAVEVAPFCNTPDARIDSRMNGLSSLCNSPELVPTLHLPSPRHANVRNGRIAGHTPAVAAQSHPSPPSSTPGTPHHSHYTSQARSQVVPAASPSAYQQACDGWTNCSVYSPPPFIYPPYMPTWSCVY